eukprot:g1758.t1
MAETLGEALIPVINKLQDIFSQITLDFKLELPQVAVVGSQSSGKSSVLEALVGRDFLPRGPEICTRRPLMLQLVRTNPADKQSSTEFEEYGEFLHIKGKRFTNFNHIKAEILKETERVAGASKGISDSPIRLKIHSPHVLTMTLVDLPGITRVPVGDQPSDIESLIRQMIISYIQHSTCIILAVSAANVDLANSDAISMAQAVDPEGIRTIGVVTKLDIMDKGTNAVALLKNEVVPLRLGYIGIVNRSQRDINNNIDIKSARRNEDSYFQDNTEYYEVIERCGVANLAQNLNKILVSHIQRLLPNLRMKISGQIERKTQEMKLYGDAPLLDTPMERGVLLLSLLTEYSQRFSAMIDGRSETVVLNLSGGAKIRDIFQNDFCRSLGEMSWRTELSNETIRTTIRNSTGVSGSLLIPQEPFELLVRRSIKTLLEPSIHCKDSVEEELLRIANDSIPPELSRFSHLQKTIIDSASEFIRSGGLPAEEMIRNLIECEYEYINYDHKDFIGGSNAVAEVMSDRRLRSNLSNQQRAELAAQVQNGPPLGGASIAERIENTSSQGGAVPKVLRNLRNPVIESLGGVGGVTSQEAGLKSLKTESKDGREGKQNTMFSGNGQQQGNWLANIFNRNDNTRDDKDPQNSPKSTTSSKSNPVPPANLPSSFVSQSKTLTGLVKTECGLLGGSQSLTNAFHTQMDLAVAITRKLVDNYMAIVQCNVGDLVPKSIMKFLVNNSKKGLQQYLIAKLYKEDLFERLISEKPEIAMKRKTCSDALRALKEAMAELDSLPQELAQQGAIINGLISN